MYVAIACNAHTIATRKVGRRSGIASSIIFPAGSDRGQNSSRGRGRGRGWLFWPGPGPGPGVKFWPGPGPGPGIFLKNMNGIYNISNSR